MKNNTGNFRENTIRFYTIENNYEQKILPFSRERIYSKNLCNLILNGQDDFISFDEKEIKYVILGNKKYILRKSDNPNFEYSCEVINKTFEWIIKNL